jgi:hypothetical protein
MGTIGGMPEMREDPDQTQIQEDFNQNDNTDNNSKIRASVRTGFA